MTYQPLNILMVTAWPPTDEAGGVSTVIRVLSEALAGSHVVHVLINDWDAVKLTTERSNNQSTHRLRLRSPYDAKHPIGGFLGWLRDFSGTLAQLQRLHRSQAIDVIHLHFASSYQFYFRILRMLGGPQYIVTLHGSDTVNFHSQSKIDRWLTRWTLVGAGRVIAVSRWLAELATGTFPDCRDIACVQNGLDLAKLDANVPHGTEGGLPIALPARFFVNVANVTYYKGQDIAIRAWSQVRQRCPDLHLVIVGERREHWDACEKLIRALDLEDRVHVVGALPRRDVFTVMGQALAMTFPSRSEGFPLAPLEAGAIKLPAICSDIAPLREIFGQEESALLVPPENPDALAEAVVRLAEDPALRKRLGEALHERVATEFTAERMAQHYLQIYRKVLQG